MTTLSTPPASSPLASLKINHAAIRVPDFDMAVAWCADQLGIGIPVGCWNAPNNVRL